MSGQSDSSRSPVSSGSTPSTANDTSHTASTPATQPIPKKSQQIKTDKPRPHMCTVCTRAFARLEHLKRHERSHTNEKPFQCAACGRCFARRDLVLRHQQKLHTTIPNIMRRGSSKDLDEHIIVLHNNTENSAPLPNGVIPELGDEQNEDIEKSADSGPTQLYSPPKTNEFSYSSSIAPQFRTQLFGQQHMLPENNIPSPIPTNSSQNTPPNQPANNTNGPNALPAYLQQEQANSQLNHILGSQTRHASFSAVSGTSYTNLKEAVEDGHPELGSQLTDELTSKNLLLSGLDLTSLGVLDWANLDGLDLSSAADKNKGAGSPTFSQLTAKQRSLKNLQQFFQMGGNLKTPTPGAPAGHNQSQTPNQNAFAAFQFNNPNHPHHLKGMTPFEYGMNPPNFMNLLAQSMIPEDTDPLVLQGEVVEAKKAQNKQKRELSASEAPSKKLKLELSPQNGSKQKVHPISVTMTHDDDWLKEIINTPYETNFPLASHQIGFIETPSLLSSPKLTSQQAPTLMSSNTDYSSLGEISSLFRSRQIDLVKQMNPHLNENDVLSSVDFGQQDVFSFITEEFRTRIIGISNITDGQFPTVSDLNHYMRLYELEFNKYFPFIHLPSLNPLVNKYEDIPLILSMASIGALYAYHDTNTLLLFSLSKFHIQKFFENEITLDNFQFKKVPLMTHQCLVLHIFITMFFDEPNMIEITHKQIKSMVGLMKSTKFNEPLERLLMPPADYLGPNLNPAQIQKSYDYFIMAQSRIRTVHIFYCLQNFRSSFMGLSVYFDSSLLSNGSFCSDESLWHTTNAKDWFSKVSSSNSRLTSLSNGAQFNELVQKLPNNMVNQNASFCHNNLFGILMYIHEKIQSSLDTHNPFNSLGWTVNVKPQLDHLIKSWELKFLSNGGILYVDSSNYELLTIHNEFKLMLPLYNLVKIKVVINLNPILSSIFQKNWNEMNAKLNVLSQQELKHEKLKQTMPYCAEIIKIWIFNIKNLDNKDVKQYSLRSPIFFVSCIYVAILIMSSYLNYLEKKVERGLSEFELVHWIECESVLGQVEQVLSPILKSSYSEILTKQGNTFKYIKQDDGLKRVRKLIEERDRHENLTEKERLHFDNEIGKEILTDKLSIKSLYLGIRILADAPVWPIAMGLAESFKDRANYLCEQ